MLVKSLGLRSVFMLLDHISNIEERDEYLVVKTPQNSRFVSANFLLFKDPPEQGALEAWSKKFREEFKKDPQVKHMKLSWDFSGDRVGDVAPFLQNGFELEAYQTLLGQSIGKPAMLNTQLEVREIDIKSNHDEWEQVCFDQMLFKPEGLSGGYYEEFSKQLMEDYRKLVEKGVCKWFGGFVDGNLVCSTGVLWNEEIVALQRVLVQRDHQRQGFCKAMLYRVGEYVAESLGGQKIVALSEKGSNTTKIYESLGLEIVEDLLSLYFYKE